VNNRLIQTNNNAGQYKLTAVTIGHGGNKKQFFFNLWHNEKGEAQLPHHLLQKALDNLHIRRGDTYTVA
jgi:hypothetical protein